MAKKPFLHFFLAMVRGRRPFIDEAQEEQNLAWLKMTRQFS
jgi:hypothetical protein